MNFFAVLNHYIHLTSVVLWIGGLAFQVFIIAPLLKRGDPSYPFLKKISKRFRYMVAPILLILVVTGGVNFHFRRAGYEFVPPGYISAIGVKVFLFAAAASLYFSGLLRSRREEEAKEESSGADPSPPGFVFTKLTLVIGLIILFLAAMLRHWKF